MICWDAAAGRTRTLSGTASTLPGVVVPNQLLCQLQPEVLVVDGCPAVNVIRVKDDGIGDSHIEQKTKDVLIVLHTLPSYMVAASELVTVVDPTHEPVVQGHANRAFDVDPCTIPSGSSSLW